MGKIAAGSRIGWFVVGAAMAFTAGLLPSLPGAEGGRIPLPDAVPGPFAPVPAKIEGPGQPAEPLEPAPPALEACKNAAAILRLLGIQLSAAQRTALGTQRLILVPLEATSLAEPLPASDEEREWAFSADEMLMAFSLLGGPPSKMLRKAENARLITPDLVLHAWHRGFARAVEYIEERRLHELLESFLSGALQNARELREQTKGSAGDRLAWAEARFAAPWILLGPPGPPDEPAFAEPDAPKVSVKTYAEIVKARLQEAIRDLPVEVTKALTAEIGLIMAAEGMSSSPLFGRYAPAKPADYTQFKPRSHYTQSSALGGYFRAMMFLGRNGFEFSGNKDAYGDAALAALLMARIPAKESAPPLQAWTAIMEITGFFAGPSDDLAYPEFQKWLVTTLGTPALGPVTAVSGETASRLAANVGKLRPAKVVSEAHTDQVTAPPADPPSFRIFGQRFGWDARILDRLTRGAPVEMPSLPSAVMIPAVFGDPYAEQVVRRSLEGNPPHLAAFEARLPQIRAELAAVTEEEWFSSLAAKQLQVIFTLASPRNGNFPAFMSGDAFRAKNLESQLGSYTELKHDTVLYAKQVYAEAGEGGERDKAPPAAKGLVQPDTAFWRELERLAMFVADGFQRHKLLPDAAEEFSRFRVFAAHVSKLRVIAEKHVSGAALTDGDWEFIRTVDFSDMAKPFRPYDQPNPGDGKCALVTDLLTDAASGQIRFEGLGRPLVMLALVGGKDGNRLVTGLAYDHREFQGGIDKGRMTDEEWRESIYRAKPVLPDRSAWQWPLTLPQRVQPDAK